MKFCRLLAPLMMLAVFPVPVRAAFFDDEDASQKALTAGAAFETVFSPKGMLSPAVLKAISEAKSSIRISAYDFISKPVSDAIVKAQRSGVDMEILLDGKKSNNLYNAAQFLIAMNLAPHRPKEGKTLRSNFIIIDGRNVILGNVFDMADLEEERISLGEVIIIRNAPELAKNYLDEWKTRWEDSERIPAQK